MKRARRTPPSKPVRTSAPQPYDARPRHVYFLSPLAYAAGPAAPASRRSARACTACAGRGTGAPEPALHTRSAGTPRSASWSSGGPPRTDGRERAGALDRAIVRPPGCGPGARTGIRGAPRGRPGDRGSLPASARAGCCADSGRDVGACGARGGWGVRRAPRARDAREEGWGRRDRGWPGPGPGPGPGIRWNGGVVWVRGSAA